MEINHVGLIADGNRRWAKRNNADYLSAYKLTMINIDKFLRETFDYGIKIVSVYLLSKDNLSRQREDLQAVIDAETYFVSEVLPQLCNNYECRVYMAGNPSLIPDRLLKATQEICRTTTSFNKFDLYLLIGYDPFDELEAALSKNKHAFSFTNFWVPKKLDCIIRTAGGPTLLSNFLPIQSGYAQINMIDKYFNDCETKDFLEIYRRVSGIKMLYGK